MEKSAPLALARLDPGDKSGFLACGSHGLSNDGLAMLSQSARLANRILGYGIGFTVMSTIPRLEQCARSLAQYSNESEPVKPQFGR